MSAFLKTDCPHCGQSIEFPSEGIGEIVPCPTCEKPFVLTPVSPSTITESIATPVASPPEEIKAQRTTRSNLSKLTEETILARTKSGDTPLHRAAKNGLITEVPIHLLNHGLFMVKNSAGETPLHVAARHGHLDQVPREFMTKELLTISTSPPYAPQGVYTTGSGYVARTETVLHIAVRCGQADRIPLEIFTPDLLSIEATGYRQTLLHDLAYANRLDLVPEKFANSDIWRLVDHVGRTPRDIIEEELQRAKQVTAVRSEPATEKQKEKLRYFGYALRDGMTKGEASDAIDECVRQFPLRDEEYYNRPATKEQLAQLQEYSMSDSDLAVALNEIHEDDSILTYGEAKDMLLESERAAELREIDRSTSPPDETQRRLLLELGFSLDTSLKERITATDLDHILSLRESPPRDEDIRLFKLHGISLFQADGLAAFALGDLIRSFGGSAQSHNRRDVNYGAACQAAMADPEYQTPTLTRDWEGFVAFAWPKAKIKEWLRAA
ncbi:MAG: hypothetical protein HOP33_20660 [Verrucomicrobia bacterium]|nr:hypothetical protein [Verrucomicrobiota bacterium]